MNIREKKISCNTKCVFINMHNIFKTDLIPLLYIQSLIYKRISANFYLFYFFDIIIIKTNNAKT